MGEVYIIRSRKAQLNKRGQISTPSWELQVEIKKGKEQTKRCNGVVIMLNDKQAEGEDS